MPPSSSKTRRALAIAVAACAFIALVVATWTLSGRNKQPPAVLNPPDPNAFVLLLKAAALLQGKQPQHVTNQISEYLHTNQQSLLLMRDALKHRGEMPASSYLTPSGPLDDLRAIQSLAGVARVQAQELERTAKWDDAASLYLDLVRLGHVASRGPLIAPMMGASIEASGVAGLNRTVSNLTPSLSRDIAEELARIEESRTTLAEVRERELYFMTQVMNSRFSAKFLSTLHPTFRKSLARTQAQLANDSAALSACKAKLFERSRQ